MPEAWTGQLIGTMHNNDITYKDLAAEMGVTKSYISMLLNGKRKPLGIQERMTCAVETLIKQKKST